MLLASVVAAGLVLQTDQEGRGIGVLAILVLIVGLFLVLNALWRGDKRRKAARDKAIVDRVLERAYQNPGEPINLRRLARQMRVRQSVVRDLCEGKLVKDGYLLRKRRPSKDRLERLFLSPSGLEAMRRRNDSGS
jgi:DNA-binding MarR family transcriptional regulator